jgi:hypothetical protein
MRDVRSIRDSGNQDQHSPGGETTVTGFDLIILIRKTKVQTSVVELGLWN